MKIGVGVNGLTVKGRIDFEELNDRLKKGQIFQFGYYGDSTLEWNEETGEYIVINTVTGSVKYRGNDLHKAVSVARGIADRYNELNDKYFHNDFERKTFKGF